jgi:pimeloyl-ACP methyl ester carboxylesterase
MTAATTRAAFALSALDDTPLFYERRGLAAIDQAVVLLDGIGCDGYVWKYLAPALARVAHVVHPHYRGHGRSAAPRDPERVSVPDLADDVAAVLDDAGVERAAVIGHSIGVQVALETARRHPGRVVGLGLLCGSPGDLLKTFRRSTALEVALPTMRDAVARAPWLARLFFRHMVPTRLAFDIATKVEVNPELLAMADFMPYLRGFSQLDAAFFLAMLAAVGQHSARDFLPSLRKPTLVIAGGRDNFTPPELSREMAEAIADAEFLLVPDGSHTAPLERPDEFERAVLGFLARRVGWT